MLACERVWCSIRTSNLIFAGSGMTSQICLTRIAEESVKALNSRLGTNGYELGHTNLRNGNRL